MAPVAFRKGAWSKLLRVLRVPSDVREADQMGESTIAKKEEVATNGGESKSPTQPVKELPCHPSPKESKFSCP